MKIFLSILKLLLTFIKYYVCIIPLFLIPYNMWICNIIKLMGQISSLVPSCVYSIYLMIVSMHIVMNDVPK